MHTLGIKATPVGRVERLQITTDRALVPSNLSNSGPLAARSITVSASQSQTFGGVDFGTSGARCSVIDSQDGREIASAKTSYSSSKPEELAESWQQALFALLDAIPAELKADMAAIAIDGTSATAILFDCQHGSLLATPKLYNEAQSPHIVDLVKSIAPKDHTTVAATSTLCKLLTWSEAGIWQAARAAGGCPVILHQADWLGFLLHGQCGITDWNNALKLGFDPEIESYPEWMTNKDFASVLPKTVVAPGALVAPVSSEIAEKTGLSQECMVCGGTTDSIAAFFAAGVDRPGQAVTSLGSTLAIKLLSESRVDNAAYGVYSHRLGDAWLVGGASNTGGAVLRKHFSDDQLIELTRRMNPEQPTGLVYTVLPSTGERFPVNDPDLEPKLTPRPNDDAVFLQAMLEGMARTEAEAFQVLQNLGATPVTEILTCGGGAKNHVWTQLRARAVEVPVAAASNGEAAYGAALLARRGWLKDQAEASNKGVELFPARVL